MLMTIRPETGVMQFPDDWPGIFLRGDDALRLAMTFDRLIRWFETVSIQSCAGVDLQVLRQHVAMLRSCEARGGLLAQQAAQLCDDAAQHSREYSARLLAKK
jgi:hypothetical protein